MDFCFKLAKKINFQPIETINFLRHKIAYFLLTLAIIYPPFTPFELVNNYNEHNRETAAMAVKQIEVEKIAAIYPKIEKKQPKMVLNTRLTAYSSTPDQTSGNPFITASGAHVHDGTIAANCLPFGAKVKFPDLYGDKIFTVEDRLAARMGCSTIDIWFPSRSQALAFGSRYFKIEVF